MVVGVVEKLVERSSLKFKTVCGLSVLDPTFIIQKPNVEINRTRTIIEFLHAANESMTQQLKNQSNSTPLLTAAVHNEFKDQFQAYVVNHVDEVGLDTFSLGALVAIRISQTCGMFSRCVLSYLMVMLQLSF